MIQNRVIRYEVQVQTEGRWVIDSVREEGEEQAMAYARLLLRLKTTEAIKIVRHRAMPSGFESHTEILYEHRTEPRDPPMTLGGNPEKMPICVSVADLYGLESRMALSRLFRMFFDKNELTATELLFGPVYQRKLQDTGSLLITAVHKVGTAQAKKVKMPPPERIKQLDSMVGAVMTRARDLGADRRKLPHFDATNVDQTWEKGKAVVGEKDANGLFLSLLTDHLMMMRNLAQKLEKILDMMTDSVSAPRLSLLEGVAADALTSPDVIKELFEPQQNLGALVITLADFIQGRDCETPMPASPALAKIVALIKAGHAPSCREALIERLCLSLETEQPLDRQTPDNDDKIIEKLIKKLLTPDGLSLVGGQRIEDALILRKIRYKQTMLRRSGLHDAADALPGRWKPILIPARIARARDDDDD